MADKTLDEDELVDGVQIAASILSRLPEPQRSAVSKAIEKKAPDAFEKIKVKMLRFDTILELSDQGVQVVLQQCSHEDILYSLKAASLEIKNTLYKNMSERRRAMFDADLTALPPLRLQQIEDAQHRVAMLIESLRQSGMVRSKAPRDVWI